MANVVDGELDSVADAGIDGTAVGGTGAKNKVAVGFTANNSVGIDSTGNPFLQTVIGVNNFVSQRQIGGADIKN